MYGWCRSVEQVTKAGKTRNVVKIDIGHMISSIF